LSNEQKRKTDSKILQVYLAEYLLQLNLGSQVSSIRELATKFDASVGTISHLLQELESFCAVKIDRRGHLGSYLESRSINVLWDIIEAGPMVIAFTIPSNLRFEGLATGIKAAIRSKGIEIYMIFIRGSSTRLKSLREGRCHAIVVSQLSADEECRKDEEIIISFPEGSWLRENRIFSRVGKLGKNQQLRVGVDPDSFDQNMITKLAFDERQVEFVKTNFSQLPRLLKNGHIDATTWNVEDERFSLLKDTVSNPLPKRVQEIVSGRDISAAIVTRKANKIVKIVLKEAIDIDALLEIQREVISGTYIPEY